MLLILTEVILKLTVLFVVGNDVALPNLLLKFWIFREAIFGVSNPLLELNRLAKDAPNEANTAIDG